MNFYVDTARGEWKMTRGNVHRREVGVLERGTIAGDVSTEEWKSDGEEFSVLLCESSSSGIGDWAISGKGGRRGTGEHGKKEGKRKKKDGKSEVKGLGED